MSDEIRMGEMKLTYKLPEQGDPLVGIEIPDFDEIPAVTQLGMLVMAAAEILFGEDDE